MIAYLVHELHGLWLDKKLCKCLLLPILLFITYFTPIYFSLCDKLLPCKWVSIFNSVKYEFHKKVLDCWWKAFAVWSLWSMIQRKNFPKDFCYLHRWVAWSPTLKNEIADKSLNQHLGYILFKITLFILVILL